MAAAEDAPKSPKTERGAAPRQLKTISEGQIRSIFVKVAGENKDTLLQGDEFAAAVENLSKVAELPDKVKRATIKTADRDSDGSVDWFEFYACVREEPLVARDAAQASKATPPRPSSPEDGPDEEGIPEEIKRKYRLGRLPTREELEARENEDASVERFRGRLPEHVFQRLAARGRSRLSGAHGHAARANGGGMRIG